MGLAKVNGQWIVAKAAAVEQLPVNCPIIKNRLHLGAYAKRVRCASLQLQIQALEILVCAENEVLEIVACIPTTESGINFQIPIVIQVGKGYACPF